MKKIITFLFFISILISCNKETNPVYEGSISIQSQSDIDNLVSQLEGKTEITGEVRIHDLINPDLSIFQNIQKIGQILEFENNELSDLSAFSSLEEVRYLVLGTNQISSLNGLENLNITEGIDIFLNSPNLDISAIQDVSATSFFNLAHIETPIPTFTNIENVIGVKLDGLTGIIDLSFLSNLKTSSERITISNSPNITSLNGLENLNSSKKVTIQQMDNLTDLSSISNILNSEELVFSENQQLSDFCPLKDLLFSNPDIQFSANNNLENPTKDEIIMDCP